MEANFSTGRTVTKTISIAKDVQTVFQFLNNGNNWPKCEIVNVRSVKKTSDKDWYDMITPMGSARLRIRANEEYGILDHDFIDPQASWTVPARVVANGQGCEFMITLFQPLIFDNDFFDEQMALMDKELLMLKQIMEL